MSFFRNTIRYRLSLQPTVQKLRFWVYSALRAPAAELQR